MKSLSLFLIILIWGTIAHSMCISYRYRPIMWNPAGNNAVIVKQGFGPEGGGSVTLSSVQLDMESVSAMISSNFSPGDSTTPETVAAKDCEKNVRNLNHTLAAHNHLNFLHESSCKPERTYLFNRKLDAVIPLDEKKRTELLTQIEFKRDALVYSQNQTHFIVVDTSSNCTAECFWVLYDVTKKQYLKKSACLPKQ